MEKERVRLGWCGGGEVVFIAAAEPRMTRGGWEIGSLLCGVNECLV
jgi:hypothetical protein